MECAVQAVNTQEANKAASNRLPPLWAMVAMVLLGWNEAMSILTSPVRLVSLVYLSCMVWRQVEAQAGSHCMFNRPRHKVICCNCERSWDGCVLVRTSVITCHHELGKSTALVVRFELQSSIATFV